MRKIHLLPVLLLAVACNNMVKNEQPSPATIDTMAMDGAVSPKPTLPVTSNMTVTTEKDLVGYWVGMFEPAEEDEKKVIYAGERMLWNYANKINLSIDSIGSGQVVGHSVVAGNARPFKGMYTLAGEVYSFDLKEPGDNQYDGIFHFTISTSDSVINGTWKAFKKIETPERKYALEKKIFRYDPAYQLMNRYGDWQKIKSKKVKDEDMEDYIDKSYFTTTGDVYDYNASTDILTKDQVSNMKKADIFILRNTIYAKHGFSFRNRQLRAYFDKQQWYIPVTADIKADFTDIEKQNITLLLRYEDHAKEYYDVFGRG